MPIQNSREKNQLNVLLLVASVLGIILAVIFSLYYSFDSTENKEKSSSNKVDVVRCLPNKEDSNKIAQLESRIKKLEDKIKEFEEN